MMPADHTHFTLKMLDPVYIHLQELAREIKMRFLVGITFILKNRRVNTGLMWFEQCSMLTYTFPWHAWSRKRKGLSGKCIFSGSWRRHCSISIHFLS